MRINTPLTYDKIKDLKAGDRVLLSGYIYTARDAAHKKMVEALSKGEDLPIDINGNVIYYVGPTPSREGMVIGSAGPTTSYRMDSYTPSLLELGLKGMIGKGNRSSEVIESMKKNKAVYFASIGGAAAYTSKCIKECVVIAYDYLESEAIRKLYIEDLPLIVAIDSKGNNFYELGQKAYLNSIISSEI
ncbi:MAG: Fe-S-containing hydro-lyase [Clostridium sp.]|uniref:Fe-S-containing hydro-lyase n=1 Tax=Clostridium sp. TaxID=1506 RepID=UPI002FCB54A0